MNVRLQHGKSLCGKVFGAFVETFNWLVDFSEDIKGDYDLNPEIGHISIDRSNPDAPIVRFMGAVGSGGSGSGVSGELAEVPGSCFQIIDNDGEKSLVNCFFNTGGITLSISDQNIGWPSECLCYLTVALNSNNSASVQLVATPRNNLAATLKRLQESADTYVFPLYWFATDGKPTIDFRYAPQLQIWEGGLK